MIAAWFDNGDKLQQAEHATRAKAIITSARALEPRAKRLEKQQRVRLDRRRAARPVRGAEMSTASRAVGFPTRLGSHNSQSRGQHSTGLARS
jgi:hypothetical protein